MAFRSISLNAATDGLEFATVYLSAAEKKLWSDAHVPFHIYSAKRDEKNRFGARWVLDVTTVATDDEPAESRKIGLGCNDRRDQFMARLQDVLDGGGVIGPVELHSLDLEGGNTVWTIQEWTGDSNVDTSSNSAA